MIEKDKNLERFTREQFSFAEKLYNDYISIRKTINNYENMKYSIKDPYITSEEFKQGFISGVKIISSLLMDI